MSYESYRKEPAIKEEMEEPMRKFLASLKPDEVGFTLLELLVVISLIGLLAAIAVPMIANTGKSSNVAAANAEMAAVQTAVNAYLSKQNPPLSSTAIDALTVSDVAAYIRQGAGVIKGEYDIQGNGAVKASGIGTWPADIVEVVNGSFVRKP
jgi:prepilin-type N-terminal cleavage/methylation domain-containing protein